MVWELWDTETGNLVGWRESENEALALVQDVVRQGWPVSALSLMPEDESLPVEVLPPGRSGEELLRRAEATAESSPTRRTA